MAEIKTIGVIGAGAMGAGIAQAALLADIDVILVDQSADALNAAARKIKDGVFRLTEKGALSQDQANRAIVRLALASDLGPLSAADLIVEAIVEKLDVKQDLFQALEAIVPAHAILATNTSSLSVAEIAKPCIMKQRVCGLHFFNPVHAMKLVEVIATPDTSAATLEAVTAFATRLGKTPVTIKDYPGFLVNLAGRAYTTEGLHVLWEQVADVATIDRIMRDGAGFRMGPLELMDFTGIDVNYPVTNIIHAGFQYDPRLKTTPPHAALLNAGRLGRKSGRGFYDYSNPSPTAEAPEVALHSGPVRARIAEYAPGFATLRAQADLADDDGTGPILVAPLGEDATTICHRLGLDPARTVAIDFTALDRNHLTLMCAPCSNTEIARVAQWLRGAGFTVEIIKDSPGFVLQRVLAMIANLGAEIAQTGISNPADIDVAMKLAQNYPKGPIEWLDHLGAANVHRILLNLQSITGSDRYRPSLWLRRAALLGQHPS
jgi:3-hydroxybutyryl-CoA dehydrogenase